jgi:hypothetical protein
MQNVVMLLKDIRKVQNTHDCRIDVVMSADRWNPIAALVLCGLTLPLVIHPRKVDLRIPIPNLYGFSDLAVHLVLLGQELIDDSGAAIPFCRELRKDDIEKHYKYYVDLREKVQWPREVYFFCMSPPDKTEVPADQCPITRLADDFVRFLGEPRSNVLNELKARQSEWSEDPNPWLLLRIGHLQDGLGDAIAARATFARGMEMYPARKEFCEMLLALNRD